MGPVGMVTSYRWIHLCNKVSLLLNEQVAYKTGVAGPKKWRPELIVVKMAVYGRRLLALISKVFFKKRTLKQFDAYGCYGVIFAFREFK